MEAALDKQAADILMLDIRNISYFADYFVICSAESNRQMKAICDEIDKALGEECISLRRREGNEDSGWILLDFGDVVVHVFDPSQRDFYELESLWNKGTPVVRIQ